MPHLHGHYFSINRLLERDIENLKPPSWPVHPLHLSATSRERALAENPSRSAEVRPACCSQICIFAYVCVVNYRLRCLSMVGLINILELYTVNNHLELAGWVRGIKWWMFYEIANDSLTFTWQSKINEITAGRNFRKRKWMYTVLFYLVFHLWIKTKSWDKV